MKVTLRNILNAKDPLARIGNMKSSAMTANWRAAYGQTIAALTKVWEMIERQHVELMVLNLDHAKDKDGKDDPNSFDLSTNPTKRKKFDEAWSDYLDQKITPHDLDRKWKRSTLTANGIELALLDNVYLAWLIDEGEPVVAEFADVDAAEE